MVRFIINKNDLKAYLKRVIYIPIWLDLLFQREYNAQQQSNIYIPIWLDLLLSFGILSQQLEIIYIPIWLDLLCLFIQEQYYEKDNLHSNMVRFIMRLSSLLFYNRNIFTFQYGQIYYFVYFYFSIDCVKIYIPIWLDLLFLCYFRLIL